MIRSKKHLKFIRSLVCVKCRNPHGKVEAAHLRAGTDGGTGLKPSDCYVLPLCRECHSIQHSIGEKSFWGDLQNAKETAELIYENTGNRDAAMWAIVRF